MAILVAFLFYFRYVAKIGANSAKINRIRID